MQIFWAIVVIFLMVGFIYSIKPAILLILDACKTKNYSKILEDKGVSVLALASIGIICLWVVIVLLYEFFIFSIN